MSFSFGAPAPVVPRARTLNEQYFTVVSRNIVGEHEYQAYRVKNPASTIVLFSTAPGTEGQPIAALSVLPKATGGNAKMVVTRRNAAPSLPQTAVENGYSTSFFQALSNVDNDEFQFVISNLTDFVAQPHIDIASDGDKSAIGYLKVDILGHAIDVRETDYPTLGVNQINELRPSESYAIQSDQRTGNKTMVLRGAVDKQTGAALSVEKDEKSGAINEKTQASYFFINVVGSAAFPGLVGMLEKTAWRAADVFVRRVPKGNGVPLFSNASLQFPAAGWSTRNDNGPRGGFGGDNLDFRRERDTRAGGDRGGGGFGASSYRGAQTFAFSTANDRASDPQYQSHGLSNRLQSYSSSSNNGSNNVGDGGGGVSNDGAAFVFGAMGTPRIRAAGVGTSGRETRSAGAQGTRSAAGISLAGGSSGNAYTYGGRRSIEELLELEDRSGGDMLEEATDDDENSRTRFIPKGVVTKGAMVGAAPSQQAVQLSQAGQVLQGSHSVYVVSGQTGIAYNYDVRGERFCLGMSVWRDMPLLETLTADEVAQEAQMLVKEACENGNKTLLASLTAVYKQDECVICMAGEPRQIFLQCGHQCVCAACVDDAAVQKNSQCYLCRGKIVARILV